MASAAIIPTWESDRALTGAPQQTYSQEDTDISCTQNVNLIQSFKHLLKMYSQQTDQTPVGTCGQASQMEDAQIPPMIMAGGLQQYLINNMKKNKELVEQPRKGFGSDQTTFHDLPDSVQLTIFSYLSAAELCQACRVCRHWYCVGSDNIHWQRRLERDVRRWNLISHTTNPAMYLRDHDDWTNKEIYLRCSPEVNQRLKQNYLSFTSLTNIFRTLWPRKTPRVVMFGPGLESSTSIIARKILEDKTGTFKTTGMFPGQFEGMGSGFTMKMSSSTFHLITLYTSSRQERESRSRDQRLQHSRLLNPANRSAEQAEAEEEEYEVRKAVKDLCRTVDAFMFVIDSQDTSTIVGARSELCAMVNDGWVRAEAPVAVASCVLSERGAPQRVPSVDVVNALGLSDLQRPWQVRDCDVDSMMGVTETLEWLVEAS